MQLARPDEPARWRVAVFVAVAGLHVLVGLIAIAARTIRVAQLRAVDTPLSLLSLYRDNAPKASTASPASARARNLKRRDATQDIERLPSAEKREPNNAITLPLDLDAKADAAAQRQFNMEENERRWRNLAGPSAPQLEWWRNNAPLARDHHVGGDSEHAQGGELITWVNDKCFYTTHGIATFGMPQTSMVCKDPPKPETELFKDMRKKLDAAAKGQAP